MEQRRHLFLDLEDTIISPVVNGWFNTNLINVGKIKKIINEFNPHQIHIFSFALWNGRELELFKQNVLPRIEKVLKREISLIPTVDDEIKSACCNLLKLHPDRVDFTDMSEFWGKQESFRLFVRFVFRNSWKNWQHENVVMLLDDMVENENFEFSNLHLSGFIKNIDQIEES